MFFLLLSSQFSVCALNLSLLFLVLAPLVILLLACLSSSSSFSSCWTFIDLQGVAQMSPAGSLWLPGLREVPLFCILSVSPAPLEHSSHKDIWGLFAWFPHLQGKLPEAHYCMVFALCGACVNESDEWWMSSSQKEKYSLGAVTEVD